MIEGPRIPVGDRVAGGAFFLLFTGPHKLATMNVFVALVAQRGRLREIGGGPGLGADGDRCRRLDRGCGQRTMTANAGCRLMCPLQHKSRGAVVERAERFPLRGVVAGFTVLPCIVRIHVTSRAALACEMVLAGGHGSRCFQRLMAVSADNRKVCSRKRELRLLVFGQCEG